MELLLRANGTVGAYMEIEDHQVDDKPSHSESETAPPGADMPMGGVPVHLADLYVAGQRNCTKSRLAECLAQLLTRYQSTFSTGDGDMGRTSKVELSISLKRIHLIHQPSHRLGLEKEAEVERQVQELLDKGFNQAGLGEWCSPVVLVRKKNGKWCFCLNYRRLNAVTMRDAYPLPQIHDSFHALSCSRYFITLDLVSGYWQVPLDVDTQKKSAFTTGPGL